MGDAIIEGAINRKGSEKLNRLGLENKSSRRRRRRRFKENAIESNEFVVFCDLKTHRIDRRILGESGFIWTEMRPDIDVLRLNDVLFWPCVVKVEISHDEFDGRRCDDLVQDFLTLCKLFLSPFCVGVFAFQVDRRDGQLFCRLFRGVEKSENVEDDEDLMKS